MTLFQALVMGFIQGATEWLPISSTGHLWLVPHMLKWQDPGAAFTAVIQLGTLLAALVYFRRDITAILSPKRSGSYAEVDRGLLAPIIIGTLPVCVLGFLLRHLIEDKFRTLPVITGSVIVFALLLLIAEKTHKAKREIGAISVMDGLLVGLGQACALIPGASRSGTTITAALAIGLERSTAARFSFLLSLPAVFLSGMYELIKTRHEILHSDMMGFMLISTAVSFIVGLASIDWLMKFLKNHPTYVFIWYRLVLGAALLGCIFMGVQ